ncbi:MAG TPA: DUF120 domain-containing protein [Methanoregulaceae archaeon]|nr:DUF120 domain-containing protein [Methanoregulaceae archaeon]
MIMPEDLQSLKVIALMGGCSGPVWVSSQSLGSELGISPQTASRRLQSLDRQLLIRRDVSPDGQHITITQTGEEELRREYSDYCQVFDKKSAHYVLRGHIITGLGEGRYYMSLEQYRRQFNEYLGFKPYPGTLNIRLDQSSIQIRKKLDFLEWIKISGFQADERTFGDVRCLRCRITEHPCGIVVPGRSHYPEDIIEVVSPVSLRKTLGLLDNDEVKVEVAYD